MALAPTSSLPVIHSEPQPEPSPRVQGPQRPLAQFDRALSARTSLVHALVSEVEFGMNLARDTGTPQAKRIHGLRRSVRRARAIVRLLRPSVPQPLRVSVDEALAEVARGLSTERDAEILPAALAALPDGVGPGMADLHAELWSQREATRTAAGPAAALAAAVEALAAVPAQFADLVPETLDWPDLGEGVRATWKRANKALRKAGTRPSARRIHAWRKSLKDLRHQLELFDCRNDDLTALTRDMGELTDLLTLRRWARSDQAGRAGRKLVKSVGAEVRGRFPGLLERGEQLLGKRNRKLQLSSIPR
jgi:CHAD domain-containing protein